MDFINKTVESNGYKLINWYKNKNAQKKVIIKDAYGYKYDVFLSSLNVSKPVYVHSDNPFSIENIKTWIKTNKKPFKILSSSYYKSTEKLEFKCLICGDIFLSSWNNTFQGGECTVCNGRSFGKSNSLIFLFPEISKEWDYKKNYPRNPSNISYNDKNISFWICTTCKCSWETRTVYDRTVKKRNCPNCNRIKSVGEELIKNILEKYGISFSVQKIFKDCKNTKSLPFDFCVFNTFSNEILFLIEYNGVQHYEPRDFFGGINRFKEQNKTDEIKKKYCKNKKIPLLIISYDKLNQIEKILISALKKYQK